MAGLGIVNRGKTTLTKEDVIKRFPQKKATLTDETVELINEANNNPDFNGDEFIEQMMTYQNVMTKNRGSISEYINALKFCAYLESSGDNYTEAYKRARANDQFVIERANLPKDSTGYRELTNAASRYRKTPMVKDILTQADLPLYLMFQGGRYQAAAVLLDEMSNAMYSKDRISAADKFLTHVKPPENMKVELDIGIKQDNIIDRYESMISDLVAHQRQEIADGKDLGDITNMAIIKKIDDEAIDADIEDN